MHVRLTILLALSALLAAPATAQEREPLQINSYGAVLDNIDLLIDHYSNFLARKYELTDEQDQYTRHLLRERSHEFLDTHQDNLRGLIETLFEVRTGGDMSADGLMAWGEAARPIYEDARQLIIAGNDDWREILSDDQKRRHDEDLKLMYESFETTETQLDRITSGEMTVDEFRNPRRARSVRRSTARATNDDMPPPGEPPSNRLDPPSDEAASAARERAQELRERLAERRRQRAEERGAMEETPLDDPAAVAPAKSGKSGRMTRNEPVERDRTEPARGETRSPAAASRREPTRRTTARTPAGKGKDHVGAWEKYVEDFIARYQLDDAQQQQARSILDDCKQRADQYLQSKKSTMERIDADLGKLKASKDKSDGKRRTSQISKLTEQQQKLRAPVDEIFEKQLKPRLDRIPTRSQVRAAEESKNKKGSKRARGD